MNWPLLIVMAIYFSFMIFMLVFITRTKTRYKSNVHYIDMAGEQRKAIIEALHTGDNAKNGLYRHWDGVTPSYDQHYTMLRAGRDVSKLYPKEIRHVVQQVVYQDDPTAFFEWCRKTQPEIMKQWAMVARTKKRVI